MEQEFWMEKAACQNRGPGLFFPTSGQDDKIFRALRICNGCSVQPQCFDYVMSLPATTSGIWAGTTQAQRDRIRHGLSEGPRPRFAAVNSTLAERNRKRYQG